MPNQKKDNRSRDPTKSDQDLSSDVRRRRGDSVTSTIDRFDLNQGSSGEVFRSLGTWQEVEHFPGFPELLDLSTCCHALRPLGLDGFRLTLGKFTVEEREQIRPFIGRKSLLVGSHGTTPHIP